MESLKINKLDNSEVEIEGEISADVFAKYHKTALDKFKKDVVVDGFRKGNVPEKVLLEKVGEGAVLQAAAEEALKDHYPKVILDNKIEAIGRPEITITKLAKDNPLGFKARTAVLPEFTLPDYKALAKKVTSKKEEPIEVTDKDLEDALGELKKREEAVAQAQNEGDKKEVIVNDDFAKKLGDFKNLDDLKEKLKEGIKKDKEHRAHDKRRAEILDALADGTTLSVPAVLVQNEQDKMFADLRFQIERSGLDFNDYLSHIKKTESELKESWRENAEKRAKINLILERIIKEEKITPDPTKVESEMTALKQMYPDVPEDKARSYAEGVLTYEQVYSLLEAKQ
ncbi:hypothetical protein CL654_00130 [bacterium]|nr:hypothetical protein [bacterium]|tara:strand:- start:4376 stop:5398 length:1023 start_codon:yes stop_codon:yes gene_type:complete